MAVRVNGTSDLPGLAEAVAVELERRHIPARIYDYTKSERAALAWCSGRSKVHRTFSLSESNAAEAARVLAAGGNVAAVCESEAVAVGLGTRLAASQVLGGDETDLRFLDPDCRGKKAGCLIWLTPKGRAKHDRSCFVQRARA